MPCPAKELAGIEPFVAIFKIECGGKTTCSGAERGWCVLARDAFGHGMPCPYWGNGRDERTRSLVFQVWRDVCCDWIGAQAEAYATGNLRRIGRGGNWSGRCDSRRRGFRGRSALRLVASRSLATRSQMRRRLRRCRWRGGGCERRSRAGRVLNVRGRVRWLRFQRDGSGRTRISRTRRNWN